ncbi:MAG: hypothetical protein ACLP52_13400 [Streptosporangiaceae bacterium]
MPVHPASRPRLRQHPQLQDVLADETWSELLGEADRRGLTPLFWQHVRPYGEVRLDMGSRLRIGESG